MKQRVIALCLLLALVASGDGRVALGGSPKEVISFFSFSLVDPRTHALVPIKVFHDGRFLLDRQIRVPHGSTFYVKLVVPKEHYVSVVFRDDASVQYDLPTRARFVPNGTKTFTWTMPPRFCSGRIEVFMSLYSAMNPNTGSMREYTVDRTGWITLGSTSL